MFSRSTPFGGFGHLDWAAVTPVMALRLRKLCGTGPDLRLNLQKRYDLQRAEEDLGGKIKAIPTLKVG